MHIPSAPEEHHSYQSPVAGVHPNQVSHPGLALVVAVAVVAEVLSADLIVAEYRKLINSPHART